MSTHMTVEVWLYLRWKVISRWDWISADQLDQFFGASFSATTIDDLFARSDQLVDLLVMQEGISRWAAEIELTGLLSETGEELRRARFGTSLLVGA